MELYVNDGNAMYIPTHMQVVSRGAGGAAVTNRYAMAAITNTLNSEVTTLREERSTLTEQLAEYVSFFSFVLRIVSFVKSFPPFRNKK